MRVRLRYWKRRRKIALGIGIAAVIVAVIAVLLVVVPSTLPTPVVTVASIDWTLNQGTHNGTLWFQSHYINESGGYFGFPFPLSPGGRFNLSLVIVNTDSVEHDICSAWISPPLYVVATNPTLPATMEATEDNVIVLTLTALAGPGATVAATGFLNATDCSG